MSGKNPLPSELAYQGVKAINPPDIISSKRDPNVNDTKYPIGSFWINTLTRQSFQLLSAPGGWDLIATAVGSNIQTLTGSSGGALGPTAGNIDIVGSNNITVPGAGSTLTITGSLTPSFTTVNASGDIISTAGGLFAETGLTTATGGVTATAGDIVATAGNIVALAGSMLADDDITSTNGDITASAGDIIATLGDIITSTGVINSASTITAGTNITSTNGNITASAGDIIATLGDVVLNAAGARVDLAGANSQLGVHGGAATDFIGTGVLTLGTVTILNTNISASDRVFIQRIANNASTTLGELTYTINAGVSLVVTSTILGTPGSTQTGDLSSFAYFIVRQL